MFVPFVVAIVFARLSSALSFELSAYDVSAERGFLPAADPLVSLPKGYRFERWDQLAAALPSLCAARAVTQRIVERELGNPSESVALIQDLRTKLELERACLVLSFVAHAYVWYSGDNQASSLPASIAAPWRATCRRLGRPTILTYYSYNLCNWRRIDEERPVELGNICRLVNFLGGQDEEWFSMVHVAIEAQGGKAVAACVAAHRAREKNDCFGVAESLEGLCDSMIELREILERMEERSDPYIYHERVRRPMAGWTEMLYEDLDTRETFFGETGAQSSLIPAIDAALGLACEDLGGSSAVSSGGRDTAKAATLIPYLRQMRDYMPPNHALLIADFQVPGKSLKEYCASHRECAPAFDAALEALNQFRTLHLGLAYRFVRQFDKRDDDQVIGTGGTAFMPYLRAHRDATVGHKIHGRDSD